MTLNILPNQLSPDLDDLYLNYVTEILEDTDQPRLIELIKMFKYCPYNSVSLNLKSLRAAEAIGSYHNTNKQVFEVNHGGQTLQEWVLSNFQTMRSDLESVANKMFAQAWGIGYSVAEIVNSPRLPGYKGEWRLFKLKVLNPCRYRFAGIGGDWDRIIYRSLTEKGEFAIPRRKLVHIYVPKLLEPENPYGAAQGVRGYPYYKARQLALQQWNEHLRKNNRGLTVIKGDPNQTIPVTVNGEIQTDGNGKAITTSALQHHVNCVVRSKEGDVLGIPKDVDYQHFPATTNLGSDYQMALEAYKKDIFMAYGIPATLLQEGNAALGQAGLSANHKLIFDTQLTKLVASFRSQIIEMVVTPLLRQNFGISTQDDLGSFKTGKFLPPENASMRANLIASGMLQGIIEPDDIDAINQYREDCGLDATTQEAFDKKQAEKLLQQQIEAAQQQYATA